jgi:hypothetical protein
MHFDRPWFHVIVGRPGWGLVVRTHLRVVR